MPLLDVSDVLGDVDFATTFDVIRSTRAVSTAGRGVSTPSTDPAFNGISGVVTPRQTTALDRLADGERQRGKISVITMFRLQTGGASLAADIVVWPSGNGDQYTVVDTDDYTQFGAGFIVAECDLLPLNPT